MHVRCPHCHNPIEVVADDTLNNVECTSCGSHFELIGTQRTATYHGTQTRIGHFELLHQVGTGKFGSVWKARDTELDRIVAVKIPRGLDEREAEQFLREARAAAQIKHPNIVSVHEVGREDGSIYIVSDFIDGANLKEYTSGQPLSFRESAALCATIADALHEAHEVGVIHRDLKPHNIMLDFEGTPYVADFGLAKREAGEITITVEGQILGTPAYMPPEQIEKAHEVDRRADVYSLGVILYELLTGELPFRGQRQMVLLQIQRDDPTAPRKLNQRIPKDLETICMKAMRKEPLRRYASAAELAQDLRAHLAGEPILARPVSAAEKSWLWCKRRPVVTTLIFGLVFAAAALQITSMRHSQALEAEQRQTKAALEESERERKFAEQSLEWLLEPILANKPERSLGRPATVDELFARVRDNIYEDEDGDELLRAKLQQSIAEVFVSLGKHDEALPEIEASYECRRRLLGEDHPETVIAESHLFDVQATISGSPEFERVVSLVERMQRVLGDDHERTLAFRRNYAVLLAKDGRWEEAEVIFVDVLERLQRLYGKDHLTTTMAIIDLAYVLKTRGDPAAEQLHRDALRIRQEACDNPRHPLVIDGQSKLGLYLLTDTEKYEEAAEVLGEGVKSSQAVFAAAHPARLNLEAAYCLAVQLSDRPKEFERFAQELVDGRTRELGEFARPTLEARLQLAEAKFFNEKEAEAKALLEATKKDASRHQFGDLVQRAESIAEEARDTAD